MNKINYTDFYMFEVMGCSTQLLKFEDIKDSCLKLTILLSISPPSQTHTEVCRDSDPAEVALIQPAADMKHPDRYKTPTTLQQPLQPTKNLTLTSAESAELLLAAGGDLGSRSGGGRRVT